MKTIVLGSILLSIHFSTQLFAQSIPLALTKPLDVGACWLNSYVAHYPGTGAAQRISIQSSINLNGNTPPYCGYSNGSLVVVDSIKVNSVLVTATGIALFWIVENGRAHCPRLIHPIQYLSIIIY